MNAIVYARKGSAALFRLAEVPKPEPKQDQVLVRVHATAVNALDYRRFEGVRLATASELHGPGPGHRMLGADIAGRVEAAGSAVTQFEPGDAVFGVSAGSTGGFAEYACAPEGRLARMPAGLSFEAAAAVPTSSMTAVQALRDKVRIRPGQKSLINGASGGVGTFAVQIAKSFGAEVTAVCSARNLDLARSIGADHAVDYRLEDFTRSGQRYDAILGVNGYHPIRDYRRALNAGGRYVAIGGTMRQILEGALLGPVLCLIGSRKAGFMGIAKPSQRDLIFVNELLETRKVTPVIDRVYPLREAVVALRYLVEEHATGKVVLTVGPEQSSEPGREGEPS
jgi:NADPH:quinone reductase-like Zn-dependent oxidoreductase